MVLIPANLIVLCNSTAYASMQLPLVENELSTPTFANECADDFVPYCCGALAISSERTRLICIDGKYSSYSLHLDHGE